MTQAFNLSQLANFVNTSGQLNAASALYNQTPVANGGTGKSSVTTGAVLIGAGTSAMTEVTGTGTGQVLASSPTGWTAAPASSVSGGDYIMNVYTSPAGWTKSPSLKAVRVTVIGGGGGGGGARFTGGLPPSPNIGGHGGGGGTSIGYFDFPALPASSIPITVGAGGSGGIAPPAAGTPNGAAGTASSFGAFLSASGGAANSGATPGAGGSGSPATSSVAISITGGRSAINGRTGSGNGTPMGIPNQYVNPAAANGAGVDGVNYGGGATGAFSASGGYAGGAGGDGIVIVEEFY